MRVRRRRRRWWKDLYVDDDEGEIRKKVWFREGEQEIMLARETTGGQNTQEKELAETHSVSTIIKNR